MTLEPVTFTASSVAGSTSPRPVVLWACAAPIARSPIKHACARGRTFISISLYFSLDVLPRQDVLPRDLCAAPGLPAAHRAVLFKDLLRPPPGDAGLPHPRDRKSTRLNSSHVASSYAVFFLKT